MKRRSLNGEKPKDDSGPQLIGYARVSTEDQNLDLQRDALQKIGCLNIYEEKRSGASRKRPELDKAIADLRPGDTLVVWKLDRLARSGYELHTRLQAVEDQKANFKSIQENFEYTTSHGKFILGVLGLVAAFERDLTIERTRAGVLARQARGLPHGAPIKLTNEKRKFAKRMLREGWTGARIAKKLKLAPNTIYKWVKSGKPMLPEAK